jgi:hypothetical protein
MIIKPEEGKQELVTLLNTIIEQNYLQFNDQFTNKTKA